MPAPTTVEELIDLAKKSGVVEDKRLDAAMAKLRAAGTLPKEPGKLAGIFVRDGVLTHFQAEQFLQGRWRRFTIGKYKVMEKLGSGGMGSVYLCEHKFMRRRAAVKVLPAAKAEDPSSLERFYREARAVAALDHPNIVRAYDIDQDDKLHFLVMEYVDGSSLQEIIKKFGPMDITRAAHYIRQAAIGLQHAHQTAGLVHRDIKPGNILIDRSGIVKVLDMGLARFFHDEDDVLTKKYDENVLGTADYLAPEQALDSHSVDIRADIYSLGATFYFVLTGGTPFSEGTVAQKLIWHQTRQPKSVLALRPEVPAEMAAVVEKMMAKDPAQRYQTPAEVAEALAPWTQQPLSPPPDKEMPRLSPAAMGAGSMGEGSVGSGQYGLPPVAPRPPAMPPSPAPTRTTSQTPTPKPTPASSFTPSSSLPPRTPGTKAAPVPAPALGTTVVATESGSARQSVALGPAPTEDSGSVAWEHLTSDTDNPSARADTTVHGPRSHVSAVEQIRQHPYFWYFVAAGVFFLVLLIGILWGMFRGSPAPKASSSSRAPRTLYVTAQKEKGDGFSTVGDALVRARPGDRIVIQKEIHEEQLLLKDGRWGNRVTIEGEGPGGGRVVWRMPKTVKDHAFIELFTTEDLHLKGFILDGDNRADDLVELFGRCPGLTLEDISCQGFKRSAVHISHCSGRADKPVSIVGLRAATVQRVEAALLFSFRQSIVDPRGNDHIRVSRCTFIGPYESAVELAGPEQDVEFQGNRFFEAENGFAYRPGKFSHPLQVSILANTFCNLKSGLTFDSLPQAANPVQESKIVLEKNLFAQIAVLAKVDTPLTSEQQKSGLTLQALARQLIQSSGNVRDPASQEGNLPVEAVSVQFPPLPQNPSNEKEFLRYPKGSPLVDKGSPGVPRGE
jgi:eukaryotic-like serine/threonine-protein kinase